MDTSEMRELLEGYLNEMNWAGGATKDDVLRHLAGRDDTLRTMVNEYVAEGTYGSPAEVLNVIPAQAWQDSQGDQWRGPTSLDPDDVDSGFQASPVGQDDSDVYRSGEPAPSTPGFGQSIPDQGGAGGGTDAGSGGAPAGGSAGAGVGDQTGTVSDLGASLGAAASGGETGATGGGAGTGGAMGVAAGAEPSTGGSGTGGPSAGAAADAGTVAVDAVVVAIDVDGDAVPDAVIVDVVVTDDGAAGDSGGSAGGQ